jgi:predicted secreted Zn-dependent protease
MHSRNRCLQQTLNLLKQFFDGFSVARLALKVIAYLLVLPLQWILVEKVSAQVYKCVIQGVTTYSDSACGSAAGKQQPLELQGNSGPRLSEMRSFAVKHYDVMGGNLEELYKSLAAKGPRGFHGLATWNVSYRYESKRSGSLCKIDDLSIRHQGEILMPRWVDAASAPKHMQARWDGIYAKLRRHEDGHIANGQEFLVRVRAALLALPSYPCESLELESQKIYAALLAVYIEKDKAFDRRTNHGEREE